MNTKLLLSATVLVMGVAATSMPAAAAKVERDRNNRTIHQHVEVKPVARTSVARTSVPRNDIHDRTDVRQNRQANRIEQGIRSGALTPQEAARLRQQQDYIRQLERQAERDGHISRAERARIEAAQNAASRSIYAEKHDSNDRHMRNHRGRNWFFGWGRRSNHDNHKRWY